MWGLTDISMAAFNWTMGFISGALVVAVLWFGVASRKLRGETRR